MATPLPVKVEIEIPEIARVLYVEHDRQYREMTARRLEQIGCAVDAVISPREATILLQKKIYDVVVVDIVFNSPDIKGDKFLVLNRELLKDKRLFALTGYKGSITCKSEFKEMEVDVINKGNDDELENAIQELVNERRRQAEEELNLAKADFLAGYSHSQKSLTREKLQIFDEVQSELLTELKKIHNKDNLKIYYGDRVYTLADIIHEVEMGTPVGLAHVKMMLYLREAEKDED